MQDEEVQTLLSKDVNDNAFEAEEASIEKLQSDRDQLKKEVAELESQRSKELQTYKSLKDKKKKIRSKYESTVWNRLDTERNIKKIGENLKLIATKVDEAEEAIQFTKSMEVTLNKLKQQLQQVQTNRQQLENQRSNIEKKISDINITLSKESSMASLLFTNRKEESNVLKQLFFSRKNIDELLLGLYSDLEYIRLNLKNESHQRCNLNTVTQIQFNQMQQLVYFAAEDRKSIDLDIDKCISSHTEISKRLCATGDSVVQLLGKLESGNFTHLEDDCNSVISSIDNNVEGIHEVDKINNSTELSSLFSTVEKENVTLKALETRQSNIAEKLKIMETKIRKLRECRKAKNVK